MLHVVEMEPAAGGDSSRFSVCVGSVQSQGFGLEGSEVGTCGSSSALPASTQGQNICPGGSLAEPALAKHPFGCAGANSRARILLQLLQSTGQLKENSEKHQNKYPEELLGNFHIFFVFCFCFQTYIEILIAGLTVCSSSGYHRILPSSVDSYGGKVHMFTWNFLYSLF